MGRIVEVLPIFRVIGVSMIKQVRLINCQSIKDSVFNLADDKLNIIIAPNGTGKSILLKMLKITASPSFFSAKKRKKLIRCGTDCATIMFAFDDGSYGYTRVFPTRVIYGFRGVGQELWENFAQPPEIFLEHLGLLVSAEGKFVANIIDTDQNLLLVDSDTKGTAELMRLLVSNQDLSNLRERTENALVLSRDVVTKLSDRLSIVSQQLEGYQFSDVDRMERTLNHMTTAKEKLFDLIRVYNLCAQLHGISKQAKDFTFLLGLCDLASLLESMPLSQVRESKFDSKWLRLCSTLEKLESFELSESSVRKEPPNVRILELLEDIEKINFHDVCVESALEFENLLHLVKILGNLEYLQSISLAYEKSLQENARASIELSKWQDLFLASGDVHHCEIYGEVIWDGKNCVPSGF